MGFLDSFRQSFDDKSDRYAQQQSYSDYRTSREVEKELEGQTDSRLLQKMKSSFTSDEEKRMIHGILLRRGYTKVGNNYRK